MIPTRALGNLCLASTCEPARALPNAVENENGKKMVAHALPDGVRMVPAGTGFQLTTCWLAPEFLARALLVDEREASMWAL